MPHIHLETSSDLSENDKIPDILEALTRKLSGFDTISSSAVKARHSLRSVWCTGEGAPAGFVHCTVAILAGRPLELRQAIAFGMVETLKEQFRESTESGEAGLTLELREMAAETYHK